MPVAMSGSASSLLCGSVCVSTAPADPEMSGPLVMTVTFPISPVGETVTESEDI